MKRMKRVKLLLRKTRRTREAAQLKDILAMTTMGSKRWHLLLRQLLLRQLLLRQLLLRLELVLRQYGHCGERGEAAARPVSTRAARGKLVALVSNGKDTCIQGSTRG